MALGARGRGKGSVDIESLEQDNDRGLEALSARTALLKAATERIQGEADSQNRILDRMDAAMMGTRGILTSVNDKFKMVMNDKQSRQTTIVALVVISVLVVFWWLTKKK